MLAMGASIMLRFYEPFSYRILTGIVFSLTSFGKT